MSVDLVGPVAGLLLAVLVNLGVTTALWTWARWVAERRAGGAWRLATSLPVAGFALSTLGLLVAVVLLVGAFRAVEASDPSVKAIALSRGIANAMNCSAHAATTGSSISTMPPPSASGWRESRKPKPASTVY